MNEIESIERFNVLITRRQDKRLNFEYRAINADSFDSLVVFDLEDYENSEKYSSARL